MCTTHQVRASAMARIAPSDGCWLWTGGGSGSGYGGFSHRVDGEVCTHRAHRYIYELFLGPIPDGLTLDHLCGVKRCVCPRHLEPVTQAENNRRAREALGVEFMRANARKTQCPNGHPYEGENLYLHGGRRHCRTCRRLAVGTHLDRVAGLARCIPGEGEPADAALGAAKAPRSAGDPFDLAAVLCGHDPLTVVGASDARADRRVWDLLDQLEGDR